VPRDPVRHVAGERDKLGAHLRVKVIRNDVVGNVRSLERRSGLIVVARPTVIPVAVVPEAAVVLAVTEASPIALRPVPVAGPVTLRTVPVRTVALGTVALRAVTVATTVTLGTVPV
jgi:hypothetical protein